MKKSGFLLTVVSTLVLALLHLPAPAAAERETNAAKPTESRVQQEQRRNALRSALAQRKKNDDAIEAKLVNRQLTEQERAEMRQQLRQQRREAELAKP